ncbi:left-handed beta-roll domain-containing protein [Phocaeicola vulgatus]|nr:left-handed beta-roll domain-containing protein [Phocaeicola vulgatus]
MSAEPVFFLFVLSPQAFGVNSIALGDNSKAYGVNSKGYGDRIHPYKKV